MVSFAHRNFYGKRTSFVFLAGIFYGALGKFYIFLYNNQPQAGSLNVGYIMRPVKLAE